MRIHRRDMPVLLVRLMLRRSTVSSMDAARPFGRRTPNHRINTDPRQLRSALALRAGYAGRYAAFDAARAFLCAMAAIGQKPDIRLREEMGVDIG